MVGCVSFNSNLGKIYWPNIIVDVDERISVINIRVGVLSILGLEFQIGVEWTKLIDIVAP